MNTNLTRNAARKCAALTIAAVSVRAAGCSEDVPGEQATAELHLPDSIAPIGKPTSLSFASTVNFDQFVTPDFFLSSGNDHASFTPVHSQGIEAFVASFLHLGSRIGYNQDTVTRIATTTSARLPLVATPSSLKPFTVMVIEPAGFRRVLGISDVDYAKSGIKRLESRKLRVDQAS
jgi:hypothetical protein